MVESNKVKPQAFVSPDKQVSGEVIWADTIRQEQRDGRFLQSLMVPLSFLGCLVIPVLILFAGLAQGQIGFVLLMAMVLFVLVKAFTSRFIMSLLYVRTHLFPNRQCADTNLVPVQNYRVRTNGGDERSVRMKGDLDASLSGHIGLGDQLTFFGDWRGGTFHAYRAFNHNTQAWTAVHSKGPWTLIVVAVFIAWLVSSVVFGNNRGESHLPANAQPPNSGQNGK